MNIQEAIEKSTRDLERSLADHRNLLSHVLNQEETGATAKACSFVECPHERVLKTTLVDTIEVLERTRKAFRSKQLERLRLRLLRVLADESESRLSERTPPRPRGERGHDSGASG